MADPRDNDSFEPPVRPSVAVALEYDPAAGDEAPRVVASGRGFIAEQILALAFAHGVRVREDADLAELLGALDLESEIPLEAFAAVAEILAYVYRANGEVPPEPPLEASSASASASSPAASFPFAGPAP